MALNKALCSYAIKTSVFSFHFAFYRINSDALHLTAREAILYLALEAYSTTYYVLISAISDLRCKQLARQVFIQYLPA